MQKVKKSKKAEKGEQTEVTQIKIGLTLKFLAGVLIPLILILTVTGILLNKEISNTVNQNEKENMQSETYSASRIVEKYFDRYFSIAETTAAMPIVRQAIWEADKTGERFTESKYYKDVLVALQNVQKNDPEVLQAVCIGNFKTSQVLQSDLYLTDPDWDITTRPYYKLVTAKNDTIATAAYQDVSNGKMVVTISSPVYDKTGTKMVGIVDMDIRLDALVDEMSQIKIGKTGYVTLYDSDNVIISHPSSEVLQKTIDEVAYSPNMLEALKQNKPAYMKYSRDNKPYYGEIVSLTDINWKVLGVVPEESYEKEVKRISGVIIACFILCIVILALISTRIVFMMVKPIKKLKEIVNKLANGDLNVELNIHSKDEIGELSNGVHKLVNRLKNYILYIDETSNVLMEIGKGNLVFEMEQDYIGEFSRLKEAMLNIQETLSKVLSKISVSVTEVSSGADQVAIAAQSVAQGATEQASTLQEISAEIQDVSTSATQEAETAVQAGQNITTIGSEIEHSNEQMQNMLKAMEDISNHSVEIGKIIKTIEDIAFQTNILALNAAVEAARAGAAGKGFAVVADEVRNLAKKSADAAKTTTELIESSIHAVGNGSELANETAASLAKVAERADKIIQDIEHIANGYQVQADKVKNISVAVDQIASVVQTNSATAEESAASGQELSNLATDMQKQVAIFTLEEKFTR